MRPTRRPDLAAPTPPALRAALVGVLAVAALLAGCTPAQAPAPEEPTPTGVAQVLLEGEECAAAEVEVGGALEWAYSGTGTVAAKPAGDSGYPLAYQLVDGDRVLTAYVAASPLPPTFVVSDGQETWSADLGEGTEGIDVAADGSGATIDAAGVGVVGEDGLAVRASFRC